MMYCLHFGISSNYKSTSAFTVKARPVFQHIIVMPPTPVYRAELLQGQNWKHLFYLNICCDLEEVFWRSTSSELCSPKE